MTTSNLSQQVSILCNASNIANSSTGTRDDLQKLISQGLQPTLDGMEIGNWKVVWLNVWKANPGDASSAADHVWFVAQNPATVFKDGKFYDTYVVAVAGLTPTSIVNLLEATLFGQVVDFEQWSPVLTPPPIAFSIDKEKPYISVECALGAHWLLTVPNSDSIPLHQLLETIPATSRIIFTGVSLGGMLSPTLAMAAVKAQSTKVPVSEIFTSDIRRKRRFLRLIQFIC